jgi:hypothetical protein
VKATQAACGGAAAAASDDEDEEQSTTMPRRAYEVLRDEDGLDPGVLDLIDWPKLMYHYADDPAGAAHRRGTVCRTKPRRDAQPPHRPERCQPAANRR